MARTMPAQKPGRSKQDYRTEQAFLAAVKRRFGVTEFDIDLAASAENAVAPLYYTVDDNALVQPWRTKARGLAWCNPPFDDIAPWVERAWTESRAATRIAMLVPAGVGSDWWAESVHGKAFVLLLNGRLCFIENWRTTIDPASVRKFEAGKIAAPHFYKAKPLYPKDCCLLIYGPDVAPGYEVWTWAANSQAAAA